MKIPKKLTHKNIILIELVGLGIIALRFTPFSEIWLQVLIAVFTSAILDICLIWYRKKLFFFVFIMLPEPQTSPVYKNSRYIYAGLTALLAVIFSLLSVKVPFNSALFFANLVTPIIHNL